MHAFRSFPMLHRLPNKRTIQYLLLLFYFWFTAFKCPAQGNNPFSLPLDSATGNITFEKIFVKKDVPKDELYSRIKTWIVEYYKSAKDVINLDDKGSGIIKVKGINTIPKEEEGLKFKQFFYYDIIFYIKDSKAKADITDLEFDDDLSGKPNVTKYERPLLFEATSKEDMKYFDTRKQMAAEISAMSASIFNSIDAAISSKSKFDF
jgi:hypothetical protein